MNQQHMLLKFIDKYEQESLLNEVTFSSIKDTSISYFKIFVSGALSLVKNTIKLLKISEIANTVIAFTRDIPLIGSLIPNRKSEEDKIKEILSVTETGNIMVTLTNINRHIFSTIWKLLPFTSAYKNNILLPIFNYNDRMGFMSALYDNMINHDVSVRHAKAMIIVLTLKIPIYNMLYVFKGFFSKKKSNPTLDDKTHPWTSGNPLYNENGLNETEAIIQKKVQKFIQLHKTSVSQVDTNYRASKMIIRESILGIVVPLLLPMFEFFKITLGVEEGSYLNYWYDGAIKTIIMVYYYYFLITGMIISTLAIESRDNA